MQRFVVTHRTGASGWHQAQDGPPNDNQVRGRRAGLDVPRAAARWLLAAGLGRHGPCKGPCHNNRQDCVGVMRPCRQLTSNPGLASPFARVGSRSCSDPRCHAVSASASLLFVILKISTCFGQQETPTETQTNPHHNNTYYNCSTAMVVTTIACASGVDAKTVVSSQWPW